MDGLTIVSAVIVDMPQDDFDPEVALPVTVEFSVSGDLLSKLMGVQSRTAPKHLNGMSEKQLLNLLNNKVGQKIFTELRPHIVSALDEVQNNFNHLLELINYDWAASEYDSASVNDQVVTYTVDVDVLFQWE
jgi:hypothetical protein